MYNNPYYHQCEFLVQKFINHGISSYCEYRCAKFGGMRLSTSITQTMCCINNSPYQRKNCKFFKDKSGSEQITLFGEIK